MAKQNLAERISDLLIGEGVDRLFSLPEVTFGKLHAALEARGVPLIAPHHETCAGYMAEAYAQLTGQIGVAAGSVGPGTINLYPAVANSYSENLPILYLGSERTVIGRSSPRGSRFQAPPSAEILRPVTKYATVLEDGRMVDDVFQEAFRQLRIGTPGPVYIGLPFDMLLESFDYGKLETPRRYRPASFTASIPEAELTLAVDLLANAKRPLIIAGAGIRLARAQAPLRHLVETLNCPVVMTFNGRGVLPDTHPNVFDFAVGPGAELTRNADVILVVGASISERMYFGGNTYFHGQSSGQQWFGSEDTQSWIHVDRDPMAIGRNHPVDLGIAADVALALPRLTEKVAALPIIDRTETISRLRQARAAYYDDLHARVKTVATVHPGQAVLEVQKILPEDVVMVRDGGAFSIWQLNFLHHAISENLCAGKQGMLGTGLPYALGAAFATKQDGRRVCLMTGDGSFGFFAMELETAVRYELPVVIVVGYDQGWSLEVPYYMHVVGRTFEVDHGFVRLDEFARVLGAHGEFCDRPEQIGPAMQRAFAAGKPALVQILIDRDVNAFEMPNAHVWTGWHGDKEVYTD